MARAKKETTLTQEEKLAQALVPESEHPYKVPENWQYIFLNGATTRIKRGKTPKYVESSDYPVFAQKCNQKDGTICIEKAQFLNPALVERLDDDEFLRDKDIVINSTGTGTLGRVGFYRSEYALPYKKVLPDSHVTVVRPEEYVLPQYLYFFLKNAQDYLELQGVGSTNQKELRPETIGAQCFPLPPFAEQQRIVDRIESLFTKLDEAKEKAQSVLDGFETRKAAILHKAFTGELTAKWRAEHGVGLDSWSEKTLDSVCSSIFDGDHMPPPKSESGIPFLVISNVNTGHLSFRNTRFVPEDYYNSLSDTRKPKYGDVLYTLVGSYGIPVIVNSHDKFCFQRHMALLKPKSVDSYFLWYLLQSQEAFSKATQIATGTAQLTVPIKGLRAITFMIPSLEEQQEIVRILDSLFTKEQRTKDIAEAMLEEIDLMKKSILARAFRGELGTNDPAEESATELLLKSF